MTPNAMRLWFVGTVHEWGWRHTSIGVAVGSLALFNMGGALFYGPEFQWLRSWVYNVFQFGLPYVFALRVADRAVADGVARLPAYGSVVIGVIVAGVWLVGPLLAPLLGGDPGWGLRQEIYLAGNMLLPFAVGTVAYAHWRRGQDMLERLRAAELDRARQEQVLQSARLLALQARVEPQFLFDALQRVQNLIDTSSQAAERLLEDLIALLRALQPAAGASASTVEREFALVAAYARASESDALAPPRLAMEAVGESAQAQIAPLVLLPALRRLVGDAPSACWQVGAQRADDRLRLAVAPSAGVPGALAALNALQLQPFHERLSAVHGPEARIAVQTAPEPALHIEVPFTPDHDPRPDR